MWSVIQAQLLINIRWFKQGSTWTGPKPPRGTFLLADFAWNLKGLYLPAFGGCPLIHRSSHLQTVPIPTDRNWPPWASVPQPLTLGTSRWGISLLFSCWILTGYTCCWTGRRHIRLASPHWFTQEHLQTNSLVLRLQRISPTEIDS